MAIISVLMELDIKKLVKTETGNCSNYMENLMDMWKLMVMFDILNVDKVCTVILHTYLTYVFTNLQQQEKTILSHSGYEYMNTPEQVMHFNPWVILHFVTRL